MEEGQAVGSGVVRPFLRESGYGTEVVDGNRYEGHFEVGSSHLGEMEREGGRGKKREGKILNERKELRKRENVCVRVCVCA
jgi:hypothetical protein